MLTKSERIFLWVIIYIYIGVLIIGSALYEPQNPTDRCGCAITALEQKD